MERDKFIELFEKNGDEYLRFEEITDAPFQSPDICAFIKLYSFMHDEEKVRDIVRSAEHDEIYLCGLDDLDLTNVTENDIIYLIKCGVRYNDDYDSFCMFV